MGIRNPLRLAERAGAKKPLPKRLRSGKRTFNYRAKFTGFPGIAAVRLSKGRLSWRMHLTSMANR